MFIAIDMDKLKLINDTLGHQEGDLAITLLAQAIKQSIRKSDYAIRLGGDEFCIILVDSTPQIAAQLPTYSYPVFLYGAKVPVPILVHAALRRELYRLAII